MLVPYRKAFDASIRFDNVTQDLATPRCVFDTGTTGFVDAFIVHDLLKLCINTIYSVREEGANEAMERLVAILTCYDLWKPKIWTTAPCHSWRHCIATFWLKLRSLRSSC